MLENTFLCIPRVGRITEDDLWNRGFITHQHICEASNYFISKKNIEILKYAIECKNKLKNRDINYFYKNLGTSSHWRIFKNFRDSTVYLDIETTGFSSNRITTISTYDGKSIKCYINGKNLDDFKTDILVYKLIVTYSGKAYDIPVIEKYFDIKIINAHIDIRYALASIDYKGGLKSCEKQAKIKRLSGLDGVEDEFPVFLWKYYKKYNSIDALNTLLAYNIEDVLSLEYLMIMAYNKKTSDLPIDIDFITYPDRPNNLYKVNKLIINRVKIGIKKYGSTYLEKKQVKKIRVFDKPNTITIPDKLKQGKPTEVTDRFWIYAESRLNHYPLPSVDSGKILIYVSIDEINETWDHIKDCTQLGILTRHSKVSTERKRQSTGKNSHVICIYTYDYTDKKDVLSIRKNLKNLGFTGKMPYKKDVDTRAGK